MTQIIVESWRLEKTTEIIQSNHWLIPTMPTDHTPQCHIYTFLEHLQGGWLQPEPPLAQLKAITSHPINSYLGEEADPHLSTTSFHAVLESDKVYP